LLSGQGDINPSATLNQVTQNGIALFDDVSIDTVGADQLLRFSSNDIAGVNSSTFEISGTLRITQQPTTTIAGARVATIRVEIVDAQGEVLPQINITLSASLVVDGHPTGGSLLTGSVVQTDHGIGMFRDLIVDRNGMDFQIRIQGQNMVPVTSDAFNVTGVLNITVQPAQGLAGRQLSAIEVTVCDALGAIIRTENATNVSAKIAIDGSSNTQISAGNSVSTVSGRAIFKHLTISNHGPQFQLVLSAVNMNGTVTTLPFGVQGLLVVSTEPLASGISMLPLAGESGNITVRVTDDNGATIGADSSTSVSVALSSPSVAAQSVLQSADGLLTKPFTSGQVIFDLLQIDKVATGYFLNFSGALLVPAMSHAFEIRVGRTQTLQIVLPTQRLISGSAMQPQPIVQLLDAGLNQVTEPAASASASVNLTTMGPDAFFLTGVPRQASIAGVCDFAGAMLSMGKIGDYKILSSIFVPSGVPSATSSATVSTFARILHITTALALGMFLCIKLTVFCHFVIFSFR
jgi:hypothetical protein